MTFIAVLVAIVLVEVFLPSFDSLAGKELNFSVEIIKEVYSKQTNNEDFCL